ncbi:hypothetical protein FS837_012377 [Tulasnella sp. UAMH 9824]|nr:hypothetical protein FS837_012377 [Tulasnella sp. UAMH 9824]
MVTLYTTDTRHFISLVFETYLCVLVLPPAFSEWKHAGTGRGGLALLKILIRDSLIWYFCLAFCLLLNALAFIAEKTHFLAKFRATQSVTTVGGPRLLINLRAAYFSSKIRDPASTLGGFPRITDDLETEGTVGRFRSALENQVDGEDEDRATSFGAGVWAEVEGSGALDDDRPGSPIVLERLPPKGKL